MLAKGPSVEAQCDVLREKLRVLGTRIVVLIDDIDRLRQEEIREVVKLVRLTGDFPNIIYVLAFDRLRVEAALGEDRESGRAYLEKIIQVSYDVPSAHAPDIGKLLMVEVARATSGLEHGPFNAQDWTNVFAKIIRPLFKTPRDIRRYVNALPPTLRVLGVEVAFADVLALEAIRVLQPEVYALLPSAIGALTGAGRDFPTHVAVKNDAPERAIESLFAAPGASAAVVRERVQVHNFLLTRPS